MLTSSRNFRELELRQHVQRHWRERVAPFSADGAGPGAGEQSAIRLFTDGNPDGPRGRGVSGAATAVGDQQYRALYALHRPDQFDI